MKKIVSLSLFIGLIAASCTDPNTIGLEIQPTSDNIIISSANFWGMTSETESEDSLRTDEALNLILGEINDAEFGDNSSSSFLTHILLTENNTDLGESPIVDSVVLSYTYSGYYGNLMDFDDLIIKELGDSISKASTYYSNFSFVDNEADLFSSFILNTDELNPSLKVNLSVAFAQDLLDLGNEYFVDNETFLKHFKGFFVSAVVENTMLYLNPDGSNSYFKIYYHNDESDSLSLDFELGGDAARINLFNPKEEIVIINDESKIHIQSMAGYKSKISINDIDSLKVLLDRKAINKVTMSFDVEETDSQNEYAAHDLLILSRVKEDGTYMKIFQPSDIGINVFLAELSESNKYEFNITRYFFQLLNNESYTSDLYLSPAGAAINANRTILEKDISLTIYYSQL